MELLISWLTLNWRWVLLVVLIVIFLLSGVKRSRHAFNVYVSKKHLGRLTKIDNVPQRFGFLRKVNPFIFEEMVLTALQKSGYRIKRNKRYTGDGGIDGRVKVNGEWVLIQAKRYKSHITQSHVIAFSQLCERHKCKGIFIHTGRTSKATWNIKGSNIDMVSGDRMIQLLTAYQYSPK
jgi:restriction system protein